MGRKETIPPSSLSYAIALPRAGRGEARAPLFRSLRSPAVVGFAESGGLRVVLRAEPAVRPGRRRIARASPQMIDADIAGDARANGKLALDAAIRRHGQLVRKQHRAD